MAETGNPNVLTIYRGRYAIPASDGQDHYCMLSCVNDVIFCGNYTASPTGDICTLPYELRPEDAISFPCYTADDLLCQVKVNRLGEVTCDRPNKDIMLRGMSFNISCNYYAGA